MSDGIESSFANSNDLLGFSRGGEASAELQEEEKCRKHFWIEKGFFFFLWGGKINASRTSGQHTGPVFLERKNCRVLPRIK